MVNEEGEKSHPPQRVVSLLGAATETLYRLGLGDTLVGRSHECDYPPTVLSLPCISRPRLDVSGSSRDIDDAVRLRSAAGEPIYKLDDDVLATLCSHEPLDLLIAQDHCRVCAVTPDDVNQSGVMSCANVKQLVLKPSKLSDCLQDVNEVANAMGVPERGIVLRRTLEERIDRVRHITKSTCHASSSERGDSDIPRVALLEWCDPIMGCGYWIPELVEVAGGTALHCPPPGGATPTISFEALLNSKPDVVIFALCGFGLTRAASEVRSAWNDTWINDLKEVTGGQLYFVDGNYLVNRSGPRIVESCEALAEAIHLELRGHFGHFGTDLLTTFDKAMEMVEAGECTGSRKVRPQTYYDKKMPEEVDQLKITSEIVCVERPVEIVMSQLRYLQEGNIAKAFALNSSANQDRWCGPERFSTVLRSHSDFRRLLKGPATVGKCEEKDGIATVEVILPESSEEEEKEVGLLWTMITERRLADEENKNEISFVWRTENVAMIDS